MKKTIMILLALMLISYIAFAEISPMFSISSVGQAIWNVAAYNGGEINSWLTQSKPRDAPRLALNVRAVSDNVRFVYTILNAGQTTYTGGNAYIEIRPFPIGFPVQAAIAVGKLEMNETRIDAVYGIYNWYRIGSANNQTVVDQEGFIFDSLLDHGNERPTGVGTGISNLSGVALRLYPIQGLTIGAGVPVSYAAGSVNALGIADVWKDANLFLGYQIANIGKVSLGWDGKWIRSWLGENTTDNPPTKYSEYWGVVQAAFEFTMVPNLYVAVGAKVPTTLGATSSSTGEAIQVNAYARYSLSDILPLRLHLLFGSKINEEDSFRSNYNAVGFQVGIGAEYDIMDNVPVFFDLRYANNIYMAGDSDANGAITAGVGISRKFSNGELGIAFELATGGYGYGPRESNTANYEGIGWAIPVKFELMF